MMITRGIFIGIRTRRDSKVNCIPSTTRSIKMMVKTTVFVMLAFCFLRGHCDSDCALSCSDEVKAAIGNQSEFCSLGEFSCVHCEGSTEVIAVHCACETGLLFHDTNETLDMLDNTWCCGTASCREAVLDFAITVEGSDEPRDGLRTMLDMNCQREGFPSECPKKDNQVGPR